MRQNVFYLDLHGQQKLRGGLYAERLDIGSLLPGLSGGYERLKRALKGSTALGMHEWLLIEGRVKLDIKPHLRQWEGKPAALEYLAAQREAQAAKPSTPRARTTPPADTKPAMAFAMHPAKMTKDGYPYWLHPVGDQVMMCTIMPIEQASVVQDLLGMRQ